MPNESKMLCLTSACLLGLCTRYDGRTRESPEALEMLTRLHAVPVPICPEQLGGLSTPRPPAILWGGDGFAVLDGRARVLDIHGRDLSAAFIRGADQALAIARMLDIRIACLKSGSPSCGGPPRFGVTAALLVRAGLEVRFF